MNRSVYESVLDPGILNLSYKLNFGRFTSHHVKVKLIPQLSASYFSKRPLRHSLSFLSDLERIIL